MTSIWVFLILMNGHIVEIGGFYSEADCDSQRKEIIVQRASLGYGDSIRPGPGYILTNYFETTKCFKVWK